ncbi:MAG: 30S ribosomal protein S21 [Candidatus Cloacimonadota bacterium]|nr:MAG: 30S ribosomal protein S21 [Candidatus Cloacimonadota bacterium]PIE78581.1 MAG: 30S ribosomal protein S21 [Candidatus Delongbacteria bacterium]
MIHVKVRDGEPFDKAFKRFTKSFEKSGVLAELRKRERFEKPSKKKRRELVAAIRKQKKLSRMENGD